MEERHMATKKSKSSKKGKVKVGQLNAKTTKVKANELKKVKGGGAYVGYDIKKNVKA
jgi:hypothetical protein